MKTIKGEFWEKEKAYTAMSNIRPLCISVKIQSEMTDDVRSGNLSNFGHQRDFMMTGFPNFMSGMPFINNFNWGSFDMDYTNTLDYEYTSGIFNMNTSEITTVEAEVEDENIQKVKKTLYADGAMAVI